MDAWRSEESTMDLTPPLLLFPMDINVYKRINHGLQILMFIETRQMNE